MLNILSLICICLNSVLYSRSFFLAKLSEAYTFLNPIVDIMLVIPVFFFFISFCVASYCKFSMRFFILS